MALRDLFRRPSGAGGPLSARVSSPQDPPSGLVAIDISSTDHVVNLRGFMVTTAGAVAVIMADGSTGTFPACQPGTQYRGLIARIVRSGTAATGIVGLL
jgi:hypothetical protein